MRCIFLKSNYFGRARYILDILEKLSGNVHIASHQEWGEPPTHNIDAYTWCIKVKALKPEPTRRITFRMNSLEASPSISSFLPIS
jgi:hypothetical protein